MPEELSPVDEARLRRLLARSRHDDRLPEDVAGRLDDVLAGLESGEPHDDLDEYAAAAAPGASRAGGVPDARRHRRRLSLLVAAAAVVVAGIGVDQVLDRSQGGDAASTSAEVSASDELADPTEGRGSDEDLAAMEEQDAGAYALDGAESGGSADAELSAEGGAAGAMAAPAADLVVVAGRLVSVRERSFADVASRLQRQLGATQSAAARTTGTQDLRDAAPRVQRAWQGCTPPQLGAGTAVAVRYDGEPAVLVLRPVEGSTQVAALLQCGTGEVLRSVTLPVD